jgi:hypothetical protein
MAPLMILLITFGGFLCTSHYSRFWLQLSWYETFRLYKSYISDFKCSLNDKYTKKDPMHQFDMHEHTRLLIKIISLCSVPYSIALFRGLVITGIQ